MRRSFAPEQIQLSNGIPVILQNYEGSAATTYWWIQTGSADEAPPEAGFAHFLEHMLFKDAAAKETGRASTGQMARSIESLGGDINAYTSFDQTVYHVTCGAQHWEKVIDAFGTMGKPQKFLKSDFDREREVILEELRKNEDSPSRQLFQRLFSSTFAKHPYGKPVIGFRKTLKAARVGSLERFYKNNYVSDRMGLVLVGPVEGRRDQIIRSLEKHFGGKVIPKRGGKRISRRAEPELRDGARFAKVEFDVKTPTIAFSFRAPELGHPDTPALDLLSSVLAMGELSRLYQRLFYQTSVATDVSGGLYIPADPGMLYFQAELADTSKINDAVEQMLTEIRRLRVEGPTEEELSRVIVNAESERLYATQTVDGLAGRLGFMRFTVNDMDFDRRFLEALKNLDAPALKSAAEKYFDPNRMSVVAMVPKGDKGLDLDAIKRSVDRILAPATLKSSNLKTKTPALGKSPALLLGKLPSIWKTPAGATVVYRERPQSHAISLHAATLGGLRLERATPIENAESDWGASYLMSLTWTKGTRTRESKEISRIVEGSAAGIDGFAGRNTVGLQLTGLSRDWDKLSELFSDVLLEPSFPEDELEHSKRIALDAIRGLEDHSSQLCSKLFLETVFEQHPYGRMSMGSIESVTAMKSEKLKAFHEMWMRPERLVLSAVGSISRRAMEDFVSRLDARMAAIKHARAVPTSILADEAPLKGPRWVERSLGREQIHIIVGGLGTRLTSPDRQKIQLMQTLLGGQSGRLFIELREKKSLAYTVSPVSFEGMENGYIGTYIACAPQKREEAVAGIRSVLEKLAQKGPTASEMKRAREYYLGRRAMDLQSDSSLATYYGLEMVYGLPLLGDDRLVEQIESITAKDIQDICRKYLVEPPMVTATVG